MQIFFRFSSAANEVAGERPTVRFAPPEGRLSSKRICIGDFPEVASLSTGAALVDDQMRTSSGGRTRTGRRCQVCRAWRPNDECVTVAAIIRLTSAFRTNRTRHRHARLRCAEPRMKRSALKLCDGAQSLATNRGSGLPQQRTAKNNQPDAPRVRQHEATRPENLVATVSCMSSGMRARWRCWSGHSVYQTVGHDQHRQSRAHPRTTCSRRWPPILWAWPRCWPKRGRIRLIILGGTLLREAGATVGGETLRAIANSSTPIFSSSLLRHRARGGVTAFVRPKRRSTDDGRQQSRHRRWPSRSTNLAPPPRFGWRPPLRLRICHRTACGPSSRIRKIADTDSFCLKAGPSRLGRPGQVGRSPATSLAAERNRKNICIPIPSCRLNTVAGALQALNNPAGNPRPVAVEAE